MSASVLGINASYNFYPQWVPVADDWNRMFGNKVDANGGYLTDPVVYGQMTLSNWPNMATDAACKAYVDAILGDSNSLPDAPADGTPYCRANHGWVPAPTTLTGAVAGDMAIGGNLSVGGTSILAGEVLIGTNVFSGYALDMVGALRTTGSATFGDVALAPRALIGPVTDAGYTLDVSGATRIVLNPNVSWLTITSNPATVPPPLLPNDTQLQFVGGDGLCSRTEYVTYGDMGILTFRKANGTGAAPTATAGNMFALIGQGYDGSAWTTSQRAAFYCIASGTWTPTSTPTWLSWWTTPVGGTTCVEGMRLQPSGNLSIGATADAGYKLDVTGSGRFQIVPPTSWLTLTANPLTLTPQVNVLLQLIGADTTAPRIEIDAFSSTPSQGGQITFRKSGGTAASPIGTSGNIGSINCYGHDGTAWGATSRGSILATAPATWTLTSNPVDFAFNVTPINAIVQAEAMRLNNAGRLLIGSATDNGLDRLQVTGTARLSSGVGVFGHVAPTTQPAFTGAKGGNTALASVIAVLVAAGFGVDTTTA